MPVIRIKQGVKLSGLQPQSAVAVAVVGSVYIEWGYDCVLTSANDGKHSKTSVHPYGFGVDFRTRNVHRDDVDTLERNVKSALGPEYDVFIESLNEPNEHLHVEWDPR